MTNPPSIVLASLRVLEAEQTPELKEQIERSRLAANKLDGHVMKKSRLDAPKPPTDHMFSQPASSSEPLARPSHSSVPDSHR